MNQSMFFSMNLLLGTGVILILCLFWLWMKYSRKEAALSFPEKIRRLSKTIDLALILMVGSLCIFASIIFAMGGTATLSLPGPIVLLPLLLEVICYFLIYRETKALLGRFEKERVLTEENALALKRIVKLYGWIVIIELAVDLAVYISGLLAVSSLSRGILIENVNVNANLELSIFMTFFVGIVLAIVAAVFDYAVKKQPLPESDSSFANE